MRDAVADVASAVTRAAVEAQRTRKGHDQKEAQWPEPEPLLAEHVEALPYPIDALPPVMRDAIGVFQAYGKQPLPVVACSAIATAALACQALADVSRDGNLVGPCSLSILIIAESGERKSAVDKRFGRAARDWQKERQEDGAPAVRAARSRVDAWQARRDGILGRIKKLSGSTNDKDENDRHELEADLIRLEAERPHVPALPEIFLEDVTPEALAVRLAEGWPSASLWSDEGGLVVGSHAMSEDSAMRFLSLLNRLWDGGRFDRRRTTRESVTIEGRRFSASLMLQPLVMAKLLGTADGMARGTGAMARNLICWPESSMGTRAYSPGDLGCQELREFDARIHQLLNMPLPLSDQERMVLGPLKTPLGRAAFEIWRQLHDDVEKELAARGEYADFRDFAAKGAEQAARIACVLHVFQHGPGGEISASDMEAGAKLALWHLHEARRALGLVGRTGEYADASVLLEWLVEQRTPLSPRDVLRNGPYRVRDKARRDRALAMLCERSLVREETHGRSSMLSLNPALGGL